MEQWIYQCSTLTAQLGKTMSSIISKLADEIALHGSYEAYCTFRDDIQEKPEQKEIPYFPDPVEVIRDPVKESLLRQLDVFKKEFIKARNQPHGQNGKRFSHTFEI